MKKIILLLLLCNIALCQNEAPTFQGQFAEIANWQKKIKAAKHDTTRLKYTDNIAYTYIYINMDSAYKYMMKSEKIAKKLPLSPIKLTFWTTCGIYYSQKADYKKSAFFYKMTYDNAIIIKHNKYIKSATANLASLKVYTGDYAGGLKDYYNLISFLDSTHEKSKRYYFGVYGNLSVIYWELKNYQKSIEFASKSLPYCETKADTLSYYMRMFEATYRVPSWQNKTLSFYYNGIKLAKTLQNTQIELQLYIGISDFYIITKNYPKALKYAQQALSISNKNNYEKYSFHAMLNIGQVYMGLRQYPKAINYLNYVVKYYNKLGDEYDVLKSLESLSIAYRNIGDYRNADKTSSEFIKVNEKVSAREKQQIMAELEVRFEIDEKEKLLKANQLALDLQKRQLKTEYQQKILISIFSFIAALLALWAFFNYFKKNKLNKALLEEKKLVETQAQQLSELNVLKDKLFAVIGHDLRSPMASLQLNIKKILTDNKQLSPDLISSLVVLHNKVNNIYEILNNLLDWSLLQIKGHQLSKETLAIETYINEAIALYEDLINKKNIHLITQISPNTTIYFNAAQIEALLRNLISNAVKFTPNDGVIRIYTDTTDPTYTKVVIRDSGIGISQEKLATIFKSSESQQGTNGEKGTGIGLMLCKDILTANDGDVLIESKIHYGTKVVMLYKNCN